MTDMETQLSRLFNAAVGEPPKSVTLRAVRRQMIRRRLIMSVTTTAALSIAAAIGLAVAANATGPHHGAVTHIKRASEPRYYFESQYVARQNRQSFTENFVRSVATGAITGSIRCPGSRHMINDAAAADNQTFFVSCTTNAGTGTRIYRFVVARSGQVGKLHLVRGGIISGVVTGHIAVTPTGSLLAIVAGPIGPGRTTQVIVIKTKSGAHAIWHTAVVGGDLRLIPYDVSFADNGRELAAFGFAGCVRGAGTCRSPGMEMVAVNNAARGGRFASGRVIFRQTQLGNPRIAFINDAFISPDGTGAITAVNAGQAIVYEVSDVSGRPLRVLLRLRQPSSYRFISPDPSGQFVLFNGTAVTSSRPYLGDVNGWISHGKILPLKQAYAITIEVW